MANLIPEVRVNKNGVPVTKHIRAGGSSGVKSVIPTPSLAAVDKKPLRLLPRQQEVKTQTLDRVRFRPSEELLQALPCTYRNENYNYEISDENAYDMFSFLKVNDALHLIHFGVRTKEEALDFLEDHGLSDLVQDNSKMMQEALRRRIPAFSLAVLHGEYGMNGYPQGIFLDAAEAFSSGTLRSLDGPTSLNTVHLRVLAGDLSMDDIKMVGISRIQKSNAAIPVLNSLQFIKNGSLECTPADVRKLIDKNNDDDSISTPLKWALNSVNDYGIDFLLSVPRLMSASAIAEYFEYQGVPVPEVKELITYEGALRKGGGSTSYAKVKALKDGGVDPVVAGRMLAQKESVERILGSHKDQVSTAVSGGWL